MTLRMIHLAAIFSAILPAGAHTVTQTGGTNVRSGPSQGSALVGTVAKGCIVAVGTAQKDGWRRVEMPFDGWIRNAVLENTAHRMWVATKEAGVREAADAGAKTIKLLKQDAEVTTVYSTANGTWVRIAKPVHGWVSREKLTYKKPEPPVDLVWPISGLVTATWNYSSGGFHGAVDIAGPAGDPAGAARDGKVATAAYGYNGGYGNYVRISHGNGWTTDYHHFTKIDVKAGQTVRRLQTIGHRGTTGMSTGNHTHFDLRRYGTKVRMNASGGQHVTKGKAVPSQFAGL